MHVLFIFINLALQNEVFIDQVIIFVTTQDSFRSSRGVVLIGRSQSFQTRSPKCNTVYWVWEAFERAHNQCALPLSFMYSKHPRAVRSGMDPLNMNPITLNSIAVLCSQCLSLSLSCLAAIYGAKFVPEKVCRVDLGQKFFCKWNLHMEACLLSKSWQHLHFIHWDVRFGILEYMTVWRIVFGSFMTVPCIL